MFGKEQVFGFLAAFMVGASACATIPDDQRDFSYAQLGEWIAEEYPFTLASFGQRTSEDLRRIDPDLLSVNYAGVRVLVLPSFRTAILIEVSESYGYSSVYVHSKKFFEAEELDNDVSRASSVAFRYWKEINSSDVSGLADDLLARGTFVAQEKSCPEGYLCVGPADGTTVQVEVWSGSQSLVYGTHTSVPNYEELRLRVNGVFELAAREIPQLREAILEYGDDAKFADLYPVGER